MTLSANLVRSALVGLTLLPMTAVAATPQSILPSGVYVAGADIALATAGRYDLDVAHTSVIARVSHLGYSWSVFRFGKAEAALDWDPARPEASKLTASVEVASIATPVDGFAQELGGKGYLNAAEFPKATFVSTAFRRTDATHGKVDGQFTLLGKTRPVTFDVELVGAGKGFGAPRLGVQATGWIDPKDYGLPAFFADPIQIVIDAEFAKATPAAK